MSGCVLVLTHRAIVLKVKKVEPNADVLRGFHCGSQTYTPLCSHVEEILLILIHFSKDRAVSDYQLPKNKVRSLVSSHCSEWMTNLRRQASVAAGLWSSLHEWLRQGD